MFQTCTLKSKISCLRDRNIDLAWQVTILTGEVNVLKRSYYAVMMQLNYLENKKGEGGGYEAGAAGVGGDDGKKKKRLKGFPKEHWKRLSDCPLWEVRGSKICGIMFSCLNTTNPPKFITPTSNHPSNTLPMEKENSHVILWNGLSQPLHCDHDINGVIQGILHLIQHQGWCEI